MSGRQQKVLDQKNAKFSFHPSIIREVPDFKRLQSKFEAKCLIKKEEMRAKMKSTSPEPFRLSSNSKIKREVLDDECSQTQTTTKLVSDMGSFTRYFFFKKEVLLDQTICFVIFSSVFEFSRRIEWDDGSVYEGNVTVDDSRQKHAEPHGYGTWRHPCGNCYEGIWERGKFSGQSKRYTCCLI